MKKKKMKKEERGSSKLIYHVSIAPPIHGTFQLPESHRP